MPFEFTIYCMSNLSLVTGEALIQVVFITFVQLRYLCSPTDCISAAYCFTIFGRLHIGQNYVSPGHSHFLREACQFS